VSGYPRAPLLLVASSSRTGPAEGQIALARHLRARGIDARFAADSVKPGDIGTHLQTSQVPWLRELKLSRHLRAADVVSDSRTLVAWVREGMPDLLHAAFAHDHLLCLWAARRAGRARENLRVFRTAHRAADVAPGPLGWRRRALARTDGVLVHSAMYRARLLALGLDPRRVLALPGSVDAQRFSPGRAPELRAEWGVPPDAPLAGIVARMKPERGHEELLRAFAAVLERLPEAWLVLVGRGEHERRLRELAAQLHVAHRVVFGGYRTGSALVAAYRALDVAVWLREGNDGACRGVLEAMACGVPVLAGDEGAPAELVGEGPIAGGAGERDGAPPAPAAACGRVVDPREPAAIAESLAALLGDPAAARRLGAAARARAEVFTDARFGEAVLAFYRAVRALPPSGRAPA
jgi:glycosyltransferase involved in cell wall biosynthesis